MYRLHFCRWYKTILASGASHEAFKRRFTMRLIPCWSTRQFILAGYEWRIIRSPVWYLQIPRPNGRREAGCIGQSLKSGLSSGPNTSGHEKRFFKWSLDSCCTAHPVCWLNKDLSRAKQILYSQVRLHTIIRTGFLGYRMPESAGLLTRAVKS